MVLLHPGALVALLLLLPLAGVEWVRLRRERRAARAVGLRPERLWRAASNGVCVGLVIALVAFAASEPSLRQVTQVPLQAGTEAYLFVDASASMLASASSHSPTRLDQARAASAEFAQAVPADLPVGAGALPQAPLPLTAPDADRALLLTALNTMTTPGLLPEHEYFGGMATDFSKLTGLTDTHFFLPQTKRRIVVIFTDAEGPSFDAGTTAARLKQVHIRLVFVRFGSPRDRIWLHRAGQGPAMDPKFTPQLADIGEVRLLAGETGGGFYESSRLRTAIARVERLAGHGPDIPGVPLSLYAEPFGPYAILAALPFLAWLAGGLLPFTVPLGIRGRRRRRSARAQPEVVALSNQV